jgi:hypothetical protein
LKKDFSNLNLKELEEEIDGKFSEITNKLVHCDHIYKVKNNNYIYNLKTISYKYFSSDNTEILVKK